MNGETPDQAGWQRAGSDVPQQPLVLSGQPEPGGFPSDDQTAFQPAAPPGPLDPGAQPPHMTAGSRPLEFGDQVRHAPSTLTGSPFQKIAQLWRADPAYKVLSIAIATVLVSGIVLAIALSGIGRPASTGIEPDPTNPNGQNTGAVTQTATNAQPTATVTAQPTATQPPTATPAPTATPVPTQPPTATSVPTQPPTGPLQITITSIPDKVGNNTSVQVIVKTQPDVQVSLSITYENAPPFFQQVQGPVSGPDGQATVTWDVSVQPLTGRTVKATVTAIAVANDGQQDTSEPEDVEISVN